MTRGYVEPEAEVYRRFAELAENRRQTGFRYMEFWILPTAKI